jgi:hypothetical protein
MYWLRIVKSEWISERNVSISNYPGNEVMKYPPRVSAAMKEGRVSMQYNIGCTQRMPTCENRTKAIR